MRRVLAGVLVTAFSPASALGATGAQLFAQGGCSGCHTLAAAGATGDGGPNLDLLRPSASAVQSQVTSGGGGMPSFGGTFTSAQIATLAAWVSSVAGGTNAGATSATTPVVTGLPPAKVRAIQRSLARLGFFHHVVTGFYGPVTKAAVAAFQRSVGLTADGLWGPKTAAAVARRTG
ncbi:MAG: peptidoglycan-binding protein [Actinobacteria bacterium]|nr:peptidoglycan-binding protein [Actinomycetota bacterium]